MTSPSVPHRIEELVIPPAWKNVWICPRPDGHIQAAGTDAAGRRQYLYHPQWHEDRSEEKFDRVLEMSALLPNWRGVVAADVRRPGLSRQRVLAVGLRLLDLGYFRAGGDPYAEENNSFGIATLMGEHVTVHSGPVEFDYPAKSGARRVLDIEDPDTVRAVRSCDAPPDPTTACCRTETVTVSAQFTPTISTIPGRGTSRLIRKVSH
ncbi:MULTISPECIES: hypothetical protein [unclassified Mycolicibacterium]|uniref:hypothetical protein n=1 Tax=unclassified Mycolicibacterium TaxID=2636767 RepID=UPI002ED90DE2